MIIIKKTINDPQVFIFMGVTQIVAVKNETNEM
jgi:hypothetical protein